MSFDRWPTIATRLSIRWLQWLALRVAIGAPAKALNAIPLKHLHPNTFNTLRELNFPRCRSPLSMISRHPNSTKTARVVTWLVDFRPSLLMWWHETTTVVSSWNKSLRKFNSVACHFVTFVELQWPHAGHATNHGHNNVVDAAVCLVGPRIAIL